MLSETIETYKRLLEEKLFSYFSENELKQDRLFKAMKYSLEAGGKRVRPILAFEFCRINGKNPEAALSAACAIEMMHTFSLIHDDLPCMDNDDFRRGRKSCHREYDEGTALLAGDALAILPFRIIAEDESLSDSQRVRMISLLAGCAGEYGMIGGQQIDTQFEGEKLEYDELKRMYELKTSRLLEAACCCGALAADAVEEKIRSAEIFAKNLGLAFQIIDDILNVRGSEAEIGKPVGTDEEKDKYTFVRLFGIEKAEAEAQRLTEAALSSLEQNEKTAFLQEFTKLLLYRNK